MFLHYAAATQPLNKKDKEGIKLIKDAKVAEDTAKAAELRHSNLAEKAKEGAQTPPVLTKQGEHDGTKAEL